MGSQEKNTIKTISQNEKQIQKRKKF